MPRKKEFIIEAIADAKDYGFVGEMIWQLPVSNLLMTRKGELIRCKDCKWWSKENDSLQGRCALLQMYPTGGWYCANAERKEE